MKNYLLAITVGPVQGFISAARRTRDFWLGSHILSEVSKSVAKSIHAGGKNGNELVFPFAESLDEQLELDSPLDVVNVILARVETDQIADLANTARSSAESRWQVFVEAAYAKAKDDIAEKSRWDEQAKDVIEFYSAWVPFEGEGDYADARKQVMRLLGGRKTLRNFLPAPGTDKGAPKCSLDGSRPTVLKKLKKGERRKSGLWTRPKEQLDVVGVVKRAKFGHDGIRFPSVSRFAAQPWLDRVIKEAEKDEGIKRAFDDLIAECETLRSAKVLTERSNNKGDLELFPFLEKFPFEGTPLYPERYPQLAQDCPSDNVSFVQIESKLKLLTKAFGKPASYFALLIADGDRMGAAISKIETVKEHQTFSAALSEFAKQVRKTVKVHDGATVFAGGDDVMAILPLHRCIACAAELREQFCNQMMAVTPNGIASPTLSAGIAIGHFMEPLEDLLAFARAAEHRAKNPDKTMDVGQIPRDALAVAIHTRNGVPFTIRGHWTNDSIAGVQQRLADWTTLHMEKQISTKAAYDLRLLSGDYDNWDISTSKSRSRLATAIRMDALRVLGRKESDKGPIATTLKGLLENIENADSLKALANELLVGQQLASSHLQAGDKPVEPNKDLFIADSGSTNISLPPTDSVSRPETGSPENPSLPSEPCNAEALPRDSSSKDTLLNISLRDPIIARDGRPFGAGLRMKSLDWPYPSVTAGSFRTMIGGINGGDYPKQIEDLKAIEIAGPFPIVETAEKSELFLPAPADFVVRKDPSSGVLESFATRPEKTNDCGCDVNVAGGKLNPVLLPQAAGDEFKPAAVPGFWSLKKMSSWLCNVDGVGFLHDITTRWPDGFQALPVQDTRMHVQMDYDAGVGEEGMLFQTTGLDAHRLPNANTTSVDLASSQPTSWSVRIRTSHPGYQQIASQLDQDQPIGGERRLAHWKVNSAEHHSIWECPKSVKSALNSITCETTAQVRMVLTTPAPFQQGWRPGWLEQTSDNRLEGTPPGINPDQLTVRLAGATVNRWKPISGWCFESNGPKPVRRLVPAGSVYFFQVVSGDGSPLVKQWLRSVCQNPQDQNDGFGLAIWGVWKP